MRIPEAPFQFSLKAVMLAAAVAALIAVTLTSGNGAGRVLSCLAAAAVYLPMAIRVAPRCPMRQWDFDWDEALRFALGWSIPGSWICLIGVLSCPTILLIVVYGLLVATVSALAHRSGRVGLLSLACWTALFLVYSVFGMRAY